MDQPTTKSGAPSNRRTADGLPTPHRTPPAGGRIRTGRVLVVHEAPLFAGMGAEVAARVADAAFEHLDAPVRRVGARDCFVPFAPNLEAAVLPSVEQIAAAIRDLLAY